MLLRLNHLDVLSVAKMYGAIMAVIGVIAGLVYACFMTFFAASFMSGLAAGAGDAGRSGMAGAMGGSLVGALCAIVFIPILYAVMGFIGGAIAAWVYNLLAPRIGGVVGSFDRLDAGEALAERLESPAGTE